MKDSERESIELQVLLRSTGELPPNESLTLAQKLRDDPEAAAFAHFIENELPLAARAPRDFAAAAIAAVQPPAKNMITFPRLWKLTAAASALVAGIFIGTQFLTHPVPPTVAATARTTDQLSDRAERIENELANTRLIYTRGRYSRHTAPL